MAFAGGGECPGPGKGSTPAVLPGPALVPTCLDSAMLMAPSWRGRTPVVPTRAEVEEPPVPANMTLRLWFGGSGWGHAPPDLHPHSQEYGEPLASKTTTDAQRLHTAPKEGTTGVQV